MLATPLGVLGLELLARGAIELGLLWFVPASVRTYVTNNQLVWDSALGWRPAAVAENVDTRALGMDRLNVAPKPPAGRLRSFALGDSQTQGGGVYTHQAWPAVAEKLLQDDGLDVELINAASPGYRSAQALEMIETRLVAWHPDFLLIDCRSRDSPRLAHHPDPTAERISAVLFESRLYRMLRLGIALVREEDVGIPHPSRIPQPDAAGEEGADNLMEIARLGAAWGIDTWFLDYPYADRTGLRAGLQPASLPSDARVIALTPVFLASGLETAALFQDMNHMTIDGNVRAAKIVVEAIEPTLRERARRR